MFTLCGLSFTPFFFFSSFSPCNKYDNNSFPRIFKIPPHPRQGGKGGIPPHPRQGGEGGYKYSSKVHLKYLSIQNLSDYQMQYQASEPVIDENYDPTDFLQVITLILLNRFQKKLEGFKTVKCQSLLFFHFAISYPKKSKCTNILKTMVKTFVFASFLERFLSYFAHNFCQGQNLKQCDIEKKKILNIQLNKFDFLILC